MVFRVSSTEELIHPQDEEGMPTIWHGLQMMSESVRVSEHSVQFKGHSNLRVSVLSFGILAMRKHEASRRLEIRDHELRFSSAPSSPE